LAVRGAFKAPEYVEGCRRAKDGVKGEATSSLTWQLDVLEAPKAEDEWWFYEGDTSFAGQGYAGLNACLWARDGRMLARGRQLFTEFSGRVPN
jgi:acyl-CoA thioesterase